LPESFLKNSFMPFELVSPNLEGFEWKDVRLALKAAIEKVCPDANVQSEWKLEFDPQTSIGKYVGAIMNGKNTHSSFVHSWHIGLSQETPLTNESGNETTIGGGTVEYDLTFALWGLFDYKSWRVKFGTTQVVGDNSSEQNATAFSEHEVRAIKAVLRVNPTIGLNTGRVRGAYPLALENSDNHPFSNGNQIIVAQTSVRVRVRESFV
jgi:hypothetical protein